MLNILRREPGFYKRLWKLSLPIILQNLITFSLGLIDTFMVSQLGNTEMAAVSTANVPAFLLISIVFGTQSGLGILVSQYWGKGDVKSINRALGVAVMIGTGTMVVLLPKTPPLNSTIRKITMEITAMAEQMITAVVITRLRSSSSSSRS